MLPALKMRLVSLLAAVGWALTWPKKLWKVLRSSQPPTDPSGSTGPLLIGAVLLAFVHLLPFPLFVLFLLCAHLHHLEIFQALLDKGLDAARVGLGLVVAEGIAGAAQGVLAEVVGRELLGLAEKLAVLWKLLVANWDKRRETVDGPCMECASATRGSTYQRQDLQALGACGCERHGCGIERSEKSERDGGIRIGDGNMFLIWPEIGSERARRVWGMVVARRAEEKRQVWTGEKARELCQNRTTMREERTSVVVLALRFNVEQNASAFIGNFWDFFASFFGRFVSGGGGFRHCQNPL